MPSIPQVHEAVSRWRRRRPGGDRRRCGAATPCRGRVLRPGRWCTVAAEDGAEARRRVTVRREWLEKDYYAVLGVDRAASAEGHQEGLPPPRPAVPPRQQPGRRRRRVPLQGHRRGERGPLRSREREPSTTRPRDAFARGAFVGGAPGGGTQYVRIDDLGDLGDLFGGWRMFGGLGDLFGRWALAAPGAPQTRRRPRGRGEPLLPRGRRRGPPATLTVEGPEGRREVTVNASLPGSTTAARIRLRGQGRPGANGGHAGDLYVRRPRRPSTRSSPGRAATSRCRCPISFTEAALGADDRRRPPSTAT